MEQKLRHIIVPNTFLSFGDIYTLEYTIIETFIYKYNNIIDIRENLKGGTKMIKQFIRELADQEYKGDFWLVDKLVRGEFE